MHRRAPRALALSAVLALSAPLAHAWRAPAPTAAQDRRPGDVYFEMLEDLEDFRRHYLSDWSTLYDFAPYERASKTWISRRELERLRALWEAERARVAAEIEAIEAEPARRLRFRIERRMRAHPYFNAIDYTWVDEHAPLHFIVQRPLKDSPGYDERVSEFYAVVLKELLAFFRARYAEPLALVLREGHGLYVTAILPTQGLYNDFADAAMEPGLYAARAHYDPSLRVAVTYEPFRTPGPPAEKRHAVLHELSHALQDAHYHGRGDMPAPTWFNEGWAEYMAFACQAAPGAGPDEGSRAEVAAVLARADLRDAYLLTLPELLDVRSYGDVVRRTWRRMGRNTNQQAALSAFYRESYLLVHFLHEGAGGKHEPALQRYARSVLAGGGGREDFEQAFAGTTLDALQREFLAWIGPQFAQVELRPAPVAGAAPGGAPVAAGATADAGAAAAGPCGAFRPEELERALAAPDVALPLALAEARAGAADAAVRRLEAALAGAEARDERLARELERLRAWRALRDRFLEHLRTTGRKLEQRLDEGRLLATIEAIQDGVLRLGENSRELAELPVEHLDPLELARQMGGRRVEFEAGWLRIYPYVLCGDERWERLLDDDEPGARALRADAEADLAELLARGAAAARVAALAAEPPPAGAEGARACLATIEALLSEHGEEPVVAAARPGLRALACGALGLVFDEGGLDAALAGEVRSAPDGRVELRYDFSERAQLDDFVAREYLDELRQAMGGGIPAGQGGFVWEAGAAVGRGRACLAHKLAFSGPTEVVADVQYREQGQPSQFLLGMCDDGYGSYIAASDGWFLQVFDKRAAYVARDSADSPPMLMIGSNNHVELLHDGAENVELKLDGVRQAKALCGPRTSGGAFLWAHTATPIAVTSLRIEGTVTPEALADLRASWIEGRLERLGL